MKFIIITLLIALSAKSEPMRPIMDEAQVLSQSTIQELNKQIRAVYSEGMGPQVVLITIKALNGQSIEEFSNKTFHSLKIGDSKRDDGVLIVIAPNDRKSRIEVGRGLEGSLTDLLSKRILQSGHDFFKSGNFNAGAVQITSEVLKVVSQKGAVQKRADSMIKENSHLDDFLNIGFVFISLILLINLLVKKNDISKMEVSILKLSDKPIKENIESTEKAYLYLKEKNNELREKCFNLCTEKIDDVESLQNDIKRLEEEISSLEKESF